MKTVSSPDRGRAVGPATEIIFIVFVVTAAAAQVPPRTRVETKRKTQDGGGVRRQPAVRARITDLVDVPVRRISVSTNR